MKANIFCVLGLVLQLLVRGFSRTLTSTSTGDVDFGSLGLLSIVGIAALVCWLIGLSAYAQSKGYSKWYSLFGLLSCCGLIILVLLPNKWTDGPPSDYGSGDYPRPNL